MVIFPNLSTKVALSVENATRHDPRATSSMKTVETHVTTPYSMNRPETPGMSFMIFLNNLGMVPTDIKLSVKALPR